jgi:hypothetical protein
VSANNEPVTATTQRIPHATLRYSTLRLGLFLVTLVLIWGIAELAGMHLDNQANRLFLLAIALVVSSVASFFALGKYRGAMSAGLVARTEKLSRKVQDAASFEDEEADA